MKFCQQLSSYLRTKEYTGDRLYGDMFEQAVLCDQGGYDSVALTEHHLINILMSHMSSGERGFQKLGFVSSV